MQEVAGKASALKDQFLAFIDEDSSAFNKIMAAFKLPKDTDEAKRPAVLPSRMPPRKRLWFLSKWDRRPMSCLPWPKQ